MPTAFSRPAQGSPIRPVPLPPVGVPAQPAGGCAMPDPAAGPETTTPVRTGARAAQGPFLLELTPPGEPTAGPGAVENLLAALAAYGRGGCALEVVGAASTGPRFVTRAPDLASRDHLAHQLQALYPQAIVRALTDEDDAVRPRPGEEAACVELRLRAPAYLPLRTYRDTDARDGADPLLGVLGALGAGSVPPGLRAVCQLALWPAERDWAAGLNALAGPGASSPRAAQGRLAEEGAGAIPLPLVGLLGAALAAYQASLLLRRGDWLHLMIGLVAVLLAIPAVLWLRDLLEPATPPDPLLVREKTAHAAAVVRLRLLVAGGTALERRLLLDALVAAYGPFTHPAGNSLTPRPTRATDLTLPRPTSGGLARPGGGTPTLLNAREIASLWHLPAAPEGVPGLLRAPLRAIVAAHPAVAGEPARRSGGLYVGVSRAQGLAVPVYLPRGHLGANTLVLGASGTGKTTYLLRLLAEVLADPSYGVFVLDPHGALAPRVLRLLPPARAREAFCVFLGDRAHPVALNLLDTKGARDPEEIENGLIGGFAYHWDSAWGARMEPIFRRALRTLLEANLARPAAAQYTLLDVTMLLTNEPFRLRVLTEVRDRDLHRYWLDEYAGYNARERDTWIQPVLNKIAAFSGRTLRNIIGQPECKVDLHALVERNAPLIVDTAAGRLGTANAGLLGATLLESLACLLRERGEGRARVLIVVDEFQQTPADWATMVEGLRKFGGHCVLATQSLTALERTQKGLRGAIFGNQATLVCHRVSADDARYLTPELDEAVESTDLINLGTRHSYVKTTDGTLRLPTFSLETPLPPRGDEAVATEVQDRSARLWGTPRATVEAAYQDYLYRQYMATKDTPDTPEGDTAADPGWRPVTVPAQGSGKPLAAPSPHQATVAPPAGSSLSPAPQLGSPTSPTPPAPLATPAAQQGVVGKEQGHKKHKRPRRARRGGSAHQESVFGLTAPDQDARISSDDPRATRAPHGPSTGGSEKEPTP